MPDRETVPDCVSWRLPNGLRVVVRPRPSTSAACVAMSYGVGFRHERPGRTGFAHLFEHLMTQGSATLAKLEHKRLVEAAGGWYSGQTLHDYTGYMSTVPAAALPIALFCEADRLRGLRITPESVQNQVSVVEQEIRGNVLSTPLGGFPYFHVDAALFTRFENNHDGYGDFADLERSTVADAEEFYADFYVPGNVVLGVAGDVDVDVVRELVDEYFADVPARPVPPPPDLAEPPLTTERHAVVTDRLISSPALALGYRVPDPVTQRLDYWRLRLLVQLLIGAADSRATVNLTAAGVVRTAVAGMGSLSDWLGTAAPASLAIGFQHDGAVSARQVLAAFDTEVARLVDELSDADVGHVAASMAAGFGRTMDQCYSSALRSATCALLYGDGELLDQVPAVWRDTSADDVRALARDWLATDARAVVEVVPS